MITPALTRNERGLIIGDERNIGGAYTEQEWRKKLCEGDDSLLQRKIDKIKERENKKKERENKKEKEKSRQRRLDAEYTKAKKKQEKIRFEALEEAFPDTEAKSKNITIKKNEKNVVRVKRKTIDGVKYLLSTQDNKLYSEFKTDEYDKNEEVGYWDEKTKTIEPLRDEDYEDEEDSEEEEEEALPPPKQKLDPVANAFGRAIFEEAQDRRKGAGNLEFGLERATEFIDFSALVITDLAKPYANDLELSPTKLVDRTFSKRRPFRGLDAKTINHSSIEARIINKTIFKDSPFKIYSINGKNEYNEEGKLLPEMTIKMDKEVDWDEVSRLVLPIATNKGLWNNIRKALVRVPFKSRTQQLPDALLGRISEYLPAENTGYYLGETEESKVRGIKDITRDPLFEEMMYKQRHQRKNKLEGTPNEYYKEENKRLGIPISSGSRLLNDQSKLPEIKEVVKTTLEKALNNKLFVDYARDKKKSSYPSAYDLTTKQKETVLKTKVAKVLKGEYAKKIDDATSPKQIADILKDLLKKKDWSLGRLNDDIYDNTYAIIGRKGIINTMSAQMPIQQSGRGHSGAI